MALHFCTNISELNLSLNTLLSNEVFIITDDVCREHCMTHLSIANDLSSNHLFCFQNGEENKSSFTYLKGIEFLANNHASRNAQILNVGGGVTTDLGGFIASTYKRGVPFIHIPTSLMGMVDAANGGKVGINHNHLKNYIGAFSVPSHTIICPTFLNTLSEQDLLSGYAEVLKHGLIADSSYWNTQKAIHPKHISEKDWLAVIQSSTTIKAAIVEADPFESGQRKILNFGHTIGHAIESLLLNANTPISHGHAVAAGIIVESHISHHATGLDDSAVDDITSHILGLFGKLPLEASDIPDLLELMSFDKKNDTDEIQMALLNNIGTCSYGIIVGTELITKCLNDYLNL